MIFKPSSFRKFFFTFICPRFYNPGSPAAPTNTTQTVNQNSIPAELMPYVKSMMGAAENQVYTKDAANKISGLQPYTPYSTNAQDYVAAFNPTQIQAWNDTNALQTPNQFADATWGAEKAGLGQLGTADTALGYGAQGAGTGQQALGYGAQGAGTGQQALGYGAQGVNTADTAQGYGAQGAGTGQQALGYGAQGAGTGQQASNYGGYGVNLGLNASGNAALQAQVQRVTAENTGLNSEYLGNLSATRSYQQGLDQQAQAGGYGSQGSQYGAQAAGQAGQGYNAQANFAQQATDPNSISAYMSPYMQNVVNQQISAANRQYDITGSQQMGEATRANAFGGSREALMAAENERARNTAIGGIQAQGLQSAFENAQGQQQFGANLGIQGLNAGTNAMQAGMQGSQVGLQGVQAQTAASNMQQQGIGQGLQGYQQKLAAAQAQTAASNMEQQGAQVGIQGVQAGLQGVQGQQQAAQVGLSGVQGAQQAAQVGLSGVQGQQQGYQLGLQGVQGAQQGYQLGLQGVQGAQQGYQLGLQGVQGAQQGYAGAAQTAGTLANIGQQQLAAQTSNIDTRLKVGGVEQAQQQQMIDQSILDYKNAQQYPYMQLGTMSNLIRGIPMTNQTTTQYQAQPSTGSQIGGALATGLGAYAALKAEGGVIKDKGYAKGGIVGYKLGGSIEESMRSKLEDLDKAHLQGIIQKNVSPVQTGLAKEVLATKLAKGGIVAFANKEEEVKDKDKERLPDLMSDFAQQEDAIQARINKQKAIKNAPIITKAPDITPIQAATVGPISGSESLKNMALNQAEGFQPPMPVAGIKAVEAPSVADKVLAPVKATPFNLDQAMGEQQQDVEKLRVDAARSEDELIAEDRKRREEQLGPDTATMEYRKKIMDERANAPDEARRQMGMRLMEFGANWASTPGAPLVAGMRALKDGLPGVMEDTKANKKAMKDIDASIYQLDHADRLEQMGYMDRAVAKKEKAQELFMKASPQVIDAAVKKQTLMIQEQEQQSTAEYRKSSLAQSAQQHADTLKQNASQFDITSSKPTEASMKQAAIADLIRSGKSESEAYGIVEAYGKATKDPALGYRVAMAKSKLDNASDIYNAALGADAKQKAYDAYQIANKEFETLQRAFDPTGEYGTTPPPSLGPNVNKGGSGLSDEDLLNKYASKTN